MAKARTPTEEEERILRENGLDPSRYCITFRDEDTIALRNYKTRDDIIVRRGDRKW